MGEKFDGLIIIGVLIEYLFFDQVIYWDELQQVFDWIQMYVYLIFGVCWGGMVMVWYFNGLEKYVLDRKVFGCFWYCNMVFVSFYLWGFLDDVLVLVSCWIEVWQDQVDVILVLCMLIVLDQVGLCLLEDVGWCVFYVFNYFEYDSMMLKDEYDRDVVVGKLINVLVNYYFDDDFCQLFSNCWCSYVYLFYGNWINEIYQIMYYDMVKIGSE